MTKLSNASDVTDINSAALSASEKNPNLKDSLAYDIANIQTYMGFKEYSSSTASSWAEIIHEPSNGPYHALDIIINSDAYKNLENRGVYSNWQGAGGPIYYYHIFKHSSAWYGGFVVSYGYNFSWFRFEENQHYHAYIAQWLQ